VCKYKRGQTICLLSKEQRAWLSQRNPYFIEKRKNPKEKEKEKITKFPIPYLYADRLYKFIFLVRGETENLILRIQNTRMMGL
jgi:hypothetical protein